MADPPQPGEEGFQGLQDRLRIGRNRGLKMHCSLVSDHADRRLVDRHVQPAEEFHVRAPALFDRRNPINRSACFGIFRSGDGVRRLPEKALTPITGGTTPSPRPTPDCHTERCTPKRDKARCVFTPYLTCLCVLIV